MILQAIKDGIVKGLRTALMLLAIMIPIYLGVTVLRHTAFFAWLSERIEPAMRIFGLPGEAVIPLVVGAFSDEYASVAAMSGFSFNMAQVTIISMIVMAFHGLPIETVITRKIGMPAFRIALFRVGLAVFTGVFVALLTAWFLGGNMPGDIPSDLAANTDRTVPAMSPVMSAGVFDASRDAIIHEMVFGVLNTVYLILRVLIPLMIGIELMMMYKVIEAMAEKMGFFCRLLGIGKDALLPLLVGLFLGVTYGAGAIAEMNRVQPLAKRDMALLGVFLFACHGIIENSYLFALAGANVVIISVVRLAIGIGVTMGAARLPIIRE